MTTRLQTTLAAVVIASLSGCGDQVLIDSEALEGAEEAGELSSELSTAVRIGSVLQTTSALRLRTGAGTRYGIVLTMPAGARVTTINRTTPVSGWYNVKYGTRTGWAYGAYLKLISQPGTSTTTTTRRDAAIARAKSGVGYSYWWGHGTWGCGKSRGSCSGGCPSCSHSGNGGADCSGYAAKVWQVPSGNTSTCVDNHPYRARDFRYTATYWHSVSRSSLKKSDALAYYSSTTGSGHVVIYGSGNGWGSMYMYEAKGCSYGIVYNLRSLSSAYTATSRNGY